MAASRRPLARLEHIRDEIDQLSAILDGVDFARFEESYVLRRTTEHTLLIISEAVKALSASVTDSYPGVDWRAIRNIGNVLRHDYFGVEPKILWKIAKDRLPELKPVIEEIRRTLSG